MEVPHDQRRGISGSDFEHAVVELLQSLGRQNGTTGVQVTHQDAVHTPDGTYRIDFTIRFEQFGAEFFVLGECKDHARPVEREDVQVLADRMRAANAHKGMFFSTSGFQRGALEYARTRRIALIQIIDGASTWFTRAAPTEIQVQPHSWVGVPAFVGQLVWLADNGNIINTIVEPADLGQLAEFASST